MESASEGESPFQWRRRMKDGREVDQSGIERWFKDGKFHREDGPAFINKEWGIETWYKEGRFHREGGPAYRNNHEELWAKNGDLHREDGPAKLWFYNGKKEWYLNGESLTKEEWWERLTPEMKMKAIFNGEGV